MTKKKDQPVAKPDYEINKYPVIYICIDCPTMFDRISLLLEGTVSTSGNIIISADSFAEQLESIAEELDIEADGDDDADEKAAFKLLDEILKEKILKNFGGDIWIYSRN
ncbi:MAG: hypothetical protein LLG40_13880 [Deltaproteobacteria bacterium]|nr:hypothetical protein [Deltaproteobacteria bacterium]